MDFAGGGGARTRRDGYNYYEVVDDEQDDPAAATRQYAQYKPFNISSSTAGAAASSSSSPPSSQIQKEYMFDKVVTPSDVGKLNRLVIPKQHAEKYFPLDSATHEKGLHLSFEDRTGKPWRFRYSYWNSSQSYVMTKGWSRFVKEKRLDAGDTVSFGRGVDDKDRLFIDWKRRPETIHDPPRGHLPRIPLPLPLPPSNYRNHHHHHHPMVSFAQSVGPWAGSIFVPPSAAVYDGHHRQTSVYNAAAAAGGGATGQYLVFRSAVAQQPQASAVQLGSSSGQDGTVQGSAEASPMVLESVPVVQIPAAAAAKRVRLFGVNLDLPKVEEKQEGPSLDLDL